MKAEKIHFQICRKMQEQPIEKMIIKHGRYHM